MANLFGMTVEQAIKFAEDSFNSADPTDAVQGYKVFCEVYKETKDDTILSILIEQYQLAKSNASLPETMSNIQAISIGRNICGQFREFQSGLNGEDALYIRSKLTGKTLEQLRQEDKIEEEKAAAKAAQAAEWKMKGLCTNCGGQLGMFKKCKSCGTKN